jgi:hypothetical protein
MSKYLLLLATLTTCCLSSASFAANVAAKLTYTATAAGCYAEGSIGDIQVLLGCMNSLPPPPPPAPPPAYRNLRDNPNLSDPQPSRS